MYNGKSYTTLRGLSNTLRGFGKTMKNLYDEHYSVEGDGSCEVCGNPTSFTGLLTGYSNTCGTVCQNRRESKRQAVAKRFVGQPEKKKRANDKRKKTYSEMTQEEKREIRDKRVRTTYKNNGVNYYSEKARKQWERRTTTEIKSIGAKISAAHIERYRNDPESFVKTKGWKEIVGPKGTVFKVQGYEDTIISFLLERFDESDILIGKNVPRIRCNENKSGIYRPDIFVKPLNLIIEVKSNYTLRGDAWKIKTNCMKQLSTFNEGYNHVIFAPGECINKNERKLSDQEISQFDSVLNMVISSQALWNMAEKVQRLSEASEYRPIAFGSGSGEEALKEARDIV